MKFCSALLMVAMAIGAMIAYPRYRAANEVRAGGAAVVPVQAQIEGPLLRILTPVANQRLNTTFVDVKYELVNPGVSGTVPNFMVQLDARDPSTTSDTSYTFTGLTPGQHTVVVQMVDANGTPITGARSIVVFFVAGNAGHMSPHPAGTVAVEGATARELAPAASSPLPLIAVVGFGALLGGVVSAMRTRR